MISQSRFPDTFLPGYFSGSVVMVRLWLWPYSQYLSEVDSTRSLLSNSRRYPHTLSLDSALAIKTCLSTFTVSFIHVSMFILYLHHSHHSNPHSLHRSCPCLLIPTPLSKMSCFIYRFHHFQTCTLLLHHIHACHLSFLSTLSIFFAPLHIDYIQTAYAFLFPFAYTHTSHHHTSMSSFRYLLQSVLL